MQDAALAPRRGIFFIYRNICSSICEPEGLTSEKSYRGFFLIPEHKICIVGLDNAGKTTILYQFLMNEVTFGDDSLTWMVKKVGPRLRYHDLCSRNLDHIFLSVSEHGCQMAIA